MRPQSAKSKGRRFQQRVCRMILAAFPDLEPDDVRSTSMGAGGEDILLSPAAQVKFPYTVECKNCEQLSIGTAFRQACAHSAHCNRTAVLFFSRNRAVCTLLWPKSFPKTPRPSVPTYGPRSQDGSHRFISSLRATSRLKFTRPRRGCAPSPQDALLNLAVCALPNVRAVTPPKKRFQGTHHQNRNSRRRCRHPQRLPERQMIVAYALL